MHDFNDLNFERRFTIYTPFIDIKLTPAHLISQGCVSADTKQQTLSSFLVYCG